MHSKKRLGQHFLKNPEILDILANSLNSKSGDLIIEIGPGHGELTERIMNRETRIMGIEKDTELAMELKKKFRKNKNVEIICGDILKILPIIPHPYKLAGNIPYYITGHLLRIIGELKEKPNITVLTIQKEVAERICAVPPSMNLLAASVQIWARSKIIRIVSKNEFSPRPKVDSAIIQLSPEPKLEEKSLDAYYALIRVLFKQPRKTILNNLLSQYSPLQWERDTILVKLKQAGINPNQRPQELGVRTIMSLLE